MELFDVLYKIRENIETINYLIVDGEAELFDISSEYADVALKDYSDYKVKELKIDVLNSQVTLELYK